LLTIKHFLNIKRKTTSLVITLMMIAAMSQNLDSTPTKSTVKEFMQRNHISQSDVKEIRFSSHNVVQAGWFSQIFGRDTHEGITMTYTGTDGCTVTSVETIGESWLWGGSSTWASTVTCG
jgi:hypothetical protein